MSFVNVEFKCPKCGSDIDASLELPKDMVITTEEEVKFCEKCETEILVRGDVSCDVELSTIEWTPAETDGE